MAKYLQMEQSPCVSPRWRRLLVGLTSVALVVTGVFGAASSRELLSAWWTLGALLLGGALHLPLTLSKGSLTSSERRVLLGSALAAQLILVFSPPVFSGDVYRYLLDGTMSVNGINPFAYAPDSPKIQDLIWELRANVNHAHLRTIYPPVAQGLFALNAWLGATVVGWKLMCLGAFSGAAVLMLRHLQRRAERCTHRREATADTAATLFFAHPLALIVVGGNGHVDTFGIAAVLGALLLLGRNAKGLAAVAVGIAASVKLFPITLVGAWLGLRRPPLQSLPTLGSDVTVPPPTRTNPPPSIRTISPSPASGGGTGAEGIAAGIIAFTVLVLSYLPLLSVGPKVLGSLGTYTAQWRFNAGAADVMALTADHALEVAGVLEAWVSPRRTEAAERADRPRIYQGEPTFETWMTRRERADQAVRAVGLFTLLGVLGWIWVRRVDAATGMLAITMALFLTAPVVHPWYVFWVLALGIAAQNKAAQVWGATVLLTFWAPAHMQVTGEWVDPVWVRGMEYVPVYGVLIWTMVAGTSPRGKGGANDC